MDETMGALPNGQVLLDLAFRRRAAGSGARGAGNTGRSRRQRGWGIQEAHLKRLIIMTRLP